MRAKPFSGKQKRLQLQEKKSRKAEGEKVEENVKTNRPNNRLVSRWDPRQTGRSLLAASQNPKYMQPLKALPSKLDTSVDIEGFYQSSAMELPSRPSWNAEMALGDLEKSENEYFSSWLDQVYKTIEPDQLGYFEHNLEVWRQFWRVTEMSSIILVVLDVRFPVLHYPIALHKYLQRIGKPVILVLMKCDLVAQELVKAWTDRLQNYFGPETIICGTCIYNLDTHNSANSKRYKSSSGVGSLLEHCQKLLNNQYPDEWIKIKNKDIRSHSNAASSALDHGGNNDNKVRKDDTLLTIGMLGHPNVGKSSLINSIVGFKVVSASRTPGHTKYFQTIHLSRHIRLCDCPGLIFPMAVSRDLQVLNGLYNIAQVRDPFGALMLAGSVIMNIFEQKIASNLEKLDPRDVSILNVCEQFAIKHGYITSKAGRPDIHRAANMLLRLTIEGKILVAFNPIGYIGQISPNTSRDLDEELSSDSSPSTTASSDDDDDSSKSDDEQINAHNPFILLESL